MASRAGVRGRAEVGFGPVLRMLVTFAREVMVGSVRTGTSRVTTAIYVRARSRGNPENDVDATFCSPYVLGHARGTRTHGIGAGKACPPKPGNRSAANQTAARFPRPPRVPGRTVGRSVLRPPRGGAIEGSCRAVAMAAVAADLSCSAHLR